MAAAAGLHYDTGGVPSAKLSVHEALALAASGTIALHTMVWTDDEAAAMEQWMPLRVCAVQFEAVVARAKAFAQAADSAGGDASPADAGSTGAADGASSRRELSAAEAAEAAAGELGDLEPADTDGVALTAGATYVIEHAETGLLLGKHALDREDVGVCCAPTAARPKAGLWTLEEIPAEEGYFGLRNGESGAHLDVLDGAAVNCGACTLHVRGVPKEHEGDEALRSVFEPFGLYLQGTVRQRSDTVVDGRVVAALSWALVTFSDTAAVDRVLAAKLVTAGGSILGLARVDAEKAMTSTGSFGQVWREGRQKAEAEIGRLYGKGEGEHVARGLSDEALLLWQSMDSQVQVGAANADGAGAHWAFEAGSADGLSVWNRKAAQCLCTQNLGKASGMTVALETDSSERSTKYILRRVVEERREPQPKRSAAPIETPHKAGALGNFDNFEAGGGMSPRTSNAIDEAIAAAMAELTAEMATEPPPQAAAAEEAKPTSGSSVFSEQMCLEPEEASAVPDGPLVFTIQHAETGLFLEEPAEDVGVCCVPAAARSKAGLWTLEEAEEGYFGLRNGESGAYLDVLDGAAVQYGACTLHVRGVPKLYEDDEALRSVFEPFGLYLQGTVRQRSDTVVDGRVVAALSWALVTFGDAAAVDRALGTKVLAGDSILGLARVDAEKAMASTGAFGQIWREGKRKAAVEIDQLCGDHDGEHEARGLSDAALSQWLSADSQVQVGAGTADEAGAQWAFEPEFRGLAEAADGLSVWNRKAALCLDMDEDTWKDGKIATGLTQDSGESGAKWNLRRVAQVAQVALPKAQPVSQSEALAIVSSPVPCVLHEDELSTLDTQLLMSREQGMKAAMEEFQRTGSTEAAANVQTHYQRMMQLAAHHGQRAEDMNHSREKIARDALSTKRRALADAKRTEVEATRQTETLRKNFEAEQQKNLELAEAFDSSWSTFIANQKSLSSNRIVERIKRRELKQLIDAWRHLAMESVLEYNAREVERVQAEAETKVAAMHDEHQQALLATKRTNSETLSELDVQKKELEEEHAKKVVTAKEETARAREMLAQVQAAKAIAVEEQANVRTRALENRVQAQIEQLSKEHMAEYASVHRQASERQSGSYEMRSSSRPLDLSGVGSAAEEASGAGKSPTSSRSSPRRASPRAGAMRSHSEHLVMAKRENKSHVEYLTGLQERLADEEAADDLDHRCRHKTLQGRRDDLRSLLEDAKATHQGGKKPRKPSPKAAAAVAGAQAQWDAGLDADAGTVSASGRPRRSIKQESSGGGGGFGLCGSAPRTPREGVPPMATQSPQMELAHDTVKPPPAWSCASKPPRAPARKQPGASPQPAKRRGGMGLCGSRPARPVQAQSPRPSQETWSVSAAEKAEAAAKVQKSLDSAINRPPTVDETASLEDIAASAVWNTRTLEATQSASSSLEKVGSEHSVGSQEWYREQRANERQVMQEASKALPEGWEAKLSHTHKNALYYVNTHSNATQWVRPTAAAEKPEVHEDSDTHKCTVHVGGLLAFTEPKMLVEYEAQLRALFSQFGEVLTCKVRIRDRMDRDGTIKKSWALVNYQKAAMAVRAVDGVAMIQKKHPGVVLQIMDEGKKLQSKGAMGDVMEKAQEAEQAALSAMLSSADYEQAGAGGGLPSAGDSGDAADHVAKKKSSSMTFGILKAKKKG